MTFRSCLHSDLAAANSAVFPARCLQQRRIFEPAALEHSFFFGKLMFFGGSPPRKGRGGEVGALRCIAGRQNSALL